ncbi:hypothetical protein CJ014_22785 [Pleomorphomonas carboxyditropha]|uniref:Uncharacterized protein n=1 Tax=Pleomorphomonas carboxyditropha TaxID=2023338 RepID=A0A2G9WQH6_9HYPH|nr:hypothetical protein CJ014_22785 [Pleomorphomonas carboxyditropha]
MPRQGFGAGYDADVPRQVRLDEGQADGFSQGGFRDQAPDENERRLVVGHQVVGDVEVVADARPDGRRQAVAAEAGHELGLHPEAVVEHHLRIAGDVGEAEARLAGQRVAGADQHDIVVAIKAEVG